MTETTTTFFYMPDSTTTLAPISSLETVWRTHAGRQIIVRTTLADGFGVDVTVGVRDSRIGTADACGHISGLVEAWFGMDAWDQDPGVYDTEDMDGADRILEHVRADVIAHFWNDEGPDSGDDDDW